MKNARRFFREEAGQDLVKYSLLLAFVALASAALFSNGGTSIAGIWTTTSQRLTTANAAAAS